MLVSEHMEAHARRAALTLLPFACAVWASLLRYAMLEPQALVSLPSVAGGALISSRTIEMRADLDLLACEALPHFVCLLASRPAVCDMRSNDQA